jgi:Flp pilus assembly protein TadD
MVGLELVTGYLIAWAVRKSRRVGGRLDAETDLVIDQGLERLHNLVAHKLGSDPALLRLDEEAGESGEAGERTRRRVQDAVADAAEHDPEFSTALEAALAELGREGGGPRALGTAIDARGAQGVQIGNHGVQHNRFG